MHDKISPKCEALRKKLSKELGIEGHEAHALELLKVLTAMEPKDWSLHFQHGRCLNELKRFPEALLALDRALKLAPDHSREPVCLCKATVYRERNMYEEAEKCYQVTAGTINKSRAWEYALRGANLIHLEKFNESLDQFNKALGCDNPDIDETYFNIGSAKRALGDYDGAIQAFQTSCEINPDYTNADTALEGIKDIHQTLSLANNMSLSKRCERAFVESERGNRDVHVVELLEPFIRRYPDHKKTKLIYGESLFNIARASDGFRVFDKALELIKLDSKRVPTYVLLVLARACADYKTPEEAEKWFLKAEKNGEDDIGLIELERGVNLIRLGNLDEAIKCFRKSLKSGKTDKSEVYLNIGLALRAMEKYGEACLSFKKAIRNGSNSVFCAEAKKCLDGLLDINNTIKFANN